MQRTNGVENDLYVAIQRFNGLVTIIIIAVLIFNLYPVQCSTLLKVESYEYFTVCRPSYNEKIGIHFPLFSADTQQI